MENRAAGKSGDKQKQVLAKYRDFLMFPEVQEETSGMKWVTIQVTPANISCFPRRLQSNTFRLPRRLQDVFKTYLQYVFLKRLEDVLEDVFKTFSRRFQDVLKTSWKTKKCYTEYVFKMSSRCLQYVCWVPHQTI